VIATSTALPDTGFADQVGAPMLAIIAIALVVVILVARRMRTAPTK
jgi:LPXTG-motif cell wall-anchored protein